jgi:ribosomal-protein-alanine N-acetyltransferase
VKSLRTSRFVLRPFCRDDKRAFDFVDSYEWRKFLFHAFPDRDQFVENCVSSEDGFDLVIEDNGKVIGSVHLGLGAPSFVGELACMITPDAWGNGIALEVCKALLRHAFADTKLRKAIAHCDSRNQASWKVLEKLGMTREGTLRRQRMTLDGELVDEYFYGILKEEWEGAA